MSKFSIVLATPEIPGNTGSIGRTAVAMDLELILIKPYGFDISERSVRRAGLDYWKHVQLKEFDSWQDFLSSETPDEDSLLFFSKKARSLFYDAAYRPGCYLIFGSETKGLPDKILKRYAGSTYSLPIYSEHVRSLNLASAVTAVSYEALRQIEFGA